ncbi:MAG: aspartate 1-decarboxylase [Chloroflexota bacterium]|nr:aspartate 1-decarboxylase [Chloroflexota bacterium]
MRTVLKSKIHRARVTDVNLDYEGSIAIDELLLEAADILPYEMVHVLNVNNGARFETYAVKAQRGSGEIAVLGAASRLAAVGDTVIILSYEVIPDEEAQLCRPRVVHVDEVNTIVREGAYTL